MASGRGVGRRPWQLVAVAGGTRGSASGGVVLIASAMQWLILAVFAVQVVTSRYFCDHVAGTGGS